MEFKDRDRKYIERIYLSGPLAPGVKEYIQRKFKEYRKQNPDFDAFLIELGNLLNEENIDYVYLKKFCSGSISIDCIREKETMFDVLVKLYNYYFSPTQAFKYIKECKDIFDSMFNANYEINNKVNISVEKECNDQSKYSYIRNKIEFIVSSEEKYCGYYFAFKVRGDINIKDNHIFNFIYVSFNYEFLSNHEKAKDALQLFDFSLRWNSILNTAEREFKRKGLCAYVPGFILNIEPAIFKDEQK